jgi:hypothetical protein
VLLTVSNTAIEQISGGDTAPLSFHGGQAGHAFGVRAQANGRLYFEQSRISFVNGGDAYDLAYFFGCSEKGGRATGILGSGTLDVSVVNSIIDNIVGGQPCPPGQLQCTFNAGEAIGIDFMGQALNVTDSSLRMIYSFPAHDSEPSFGIRTNDTNTILLSGNQIILADPEPITVASSAISDRTPGCSSPEADRSAIDVKNSTSFIAVNNVIENDMSNIYNYVYPSGWTMGGSVLGIYAEQVEQVNLKGNSVNRIVGGVRSSEGIVLKDIDQADLTANSVENVHAYSFYVEPAYGSDGYHVGGPGLGISFQGRFYRCVNNVIHNVTSGHSSAKAVEIDADSAEIQFNTIRETETGATTYRIATGLQVTAETELVIGNNSIVEHELGLSVVATGTLWSDYNNLWANAVDYSGVAPGIHDVKADPLFNTAPDSDFELTSESPLIDVGYSNGAPAWDIESNARPADGNADGVWEVDIGADEYWPPRSIKTYFEVLPQTATPGNTLAHTITVANFDNAYTWYALSMHYSIPDEYMLVDGTVGTSTGTVEVEGNAIVWSDDLQPNQHAHISFEVLVNEELSGPYAIWSYVQVLQSNNLIDSAESVVFIDPIQIFMPIMRNEH